MVSSNEGVDRFFHNSLKYNNKHYHCGNRIYSRAECRYHIKRKSYIFCTRQLQKKKIVVIRRQLLIKTIFETAITK